MATLLVNYQSSPAHDADALRQALTGLGTDDQAIIEILGRRNVHQRQKIRETYEVIYQEDLLNRFKSETSGDFERAVYRWMLEPADRDAVLVNVAIKNGTKDCHVIAEIACVLSAEELLAVRRAYHNRYKRSLEEDLAANTTGDLRQLLVGLVTAFRYEGDEINGDLAKDEAIVLHKTVKEKRGNYEEVIRILTTRSKTQLVATFNRYRDDRGISINRKLLDHASDDFQKVLHTAVCCINDHKKYYVKVLCNSIKEGTDEDGLNRVVVTRAEKDLKDIKDLYYKRNSVQLVDAVSNYTSGDYKEFILTLLGEQE